MSKVIELAREAGLIAAKAEFSLHDKKLTKFYELSRADLEAENAKLRNALVLINSMTYDPWTNGAEAQSIARAALGETNAD